MLAVALPLLLAFAPLRADVASHSVEFTARATEVGAGTTIEFAFVGPESDRAYEAMFVTDASIAEIAKAFDAAGIPKGKAISHRDCRFWPAGKTVKIEPALSSYIIDANGTNAPPLVYAGGLRDATDMPIANTNAPNALFALYSLDQSLLLLDDALDQSAVYGRFKCTGRAISGQRYSFKVSWDGITGTEFRQLCLEPGRIREAIASLRNGKCDLDVMPVFSPELTCAEAKAAALGLSSVDSRALRINGHAEGQFFYQGFLPDEKWRDRTKRLTQPFEIQLSTTNMVCTMIDEDWSVEGDDPKLIPHEEPLDSVGKKFKGDTVLFYVSPSERLGRVFAIMKKLPKSIRNLYVFID